MKVVFFADWESPDERLKGTTVILRTWCGSRSEEGGVIVSPLPAVRGEVASVRGPSG